MEMIKYDPETDEFEEINGGLEVVDDDEVKK